MKFDEGILEDVRSNAKIQYTRTSRVIRDRGKMESNIKKMIHHVIIDNPRQWHKIIPFTVWAIREVPNATTGVAPYMLVYGRLQRGPLAVLKESWTGDINLPPRLGLQPKKYLQKMKENLEKALVYANEHSKEKQLQYTNQYN